MLYGQIIMVQIFPWDRRRQIKINVNYLNIFVCLLMSTSEICAK